MSGTVSKYVVLVDTGGRPYTVDGASQFSLGFVRESEAWAEFWKQVSQQPDDGLPLRGYDPEWVLAARTGLNQPESPSRYRRWTISIIKEEA